MEFFEKLGSAVGRRWKERNYNEDAFSDIALEALHSLPPHRHITLWDIVKWTATSEQLPTQADPEARFGDPPLTMYRGRDFYIDVLFWTQGVPAIHQHDFSGAFHVLWGESVHSLWDFRTKERIGTRLKLGDVVFLNAELLKRGDSRPILAGDDLFHATYHLMNPSVSVVIRTALEVDKQPQYVLLPPTVAFAQAIPIPVVRRQVQVLVMLLRSGRHAEYVEIARHMLATKDAYTVFYILKDTIAALEDETQRHALILTARMRHPELMQALEPVLRQEEAGRKIVEWRQRLNSPDLKFLLALLRNVPDRDALLKLVAARYPARDPVSEVACRIRELSELGALGAKLSEPWHLLIRCMLSGFSRKHTLQEFERAHGAEYARHISLRLEKMSADLSAMPLLGPALGKSVVCESARVGNSASGMPEHSELAGSAPQLTGTHGG